MIATDLSLLRAHRITLDLLRPANTACRLVRLCMVWAFITFVGVASAAAGTIPPSVEKMIRNAQKLNNGEHFMAVVRLAMEAEPTLRDDILALVKELEPAREPEAQQVALALPPAPPPPPKPTGFIGTDGWTGSAKIGGDKKTGNTDETNLSTALAMKREGDLWTQHVAFSSQFSETDGDTTDEVYNAGYKADRAISERSYLYGGMAYENDKFSGFDYRLTNSVGYGYKILKKPHHTWSVEAGPGIRVNKINESNSTQSEFVGRGASYYALDLYDGVKLTNNSIILVGEDNTTLDNTIALKIRIIGQLGAEFSYNVTHDTDPPADDEKTNTHFIGALVYDF